MYYEILRKSKICKNETSFNTGGIGERTRRILCNNLSLGKRQPRIEQLQKIADALEVDINYLVHGKTLQKYEQAMIEELRLAAEANKTGDDSKLKAFIAQNLPHVTVKAGWESVSTDQNRTRMNAAFDQLNPEGQAVAADQVENLTYNPKYQKKESE